jgi:hypothetical protein
MASSRPKRKTAVLSLRIAPHVKTAAQRAAELEYRSLASFIEVLVINHCKNAGIAVEKENPEEEHNEKADHTNFKSPDEI